MTDCAGAAHSASAGPADPVEDLPLNVLAIVADARATWQDDKGGKSAASQSPHCAHHFRQAADTFDRPEDTTDEERAATADMAGAYIEAATIHAREADLTAI
ncbi:hypothetical protein [Streptomyces sp. NRRL S-118]|uniref:hypothetical protein n=1 Tax=Streptomyces sp. NRRL S-118 TaxID=1463881 RepID=UPI0006940E89|nr:hypothetical protein [Streptomyces sp. NRRL S-118]